MFIYNLKLNSSIVFKIVLAIVIFAVACMCIIVGIKIYKESINSNNCMEPKSVTEITNKNYATILQTVHNDVDSYIGKKFKYSGFIYRVYDLSKEQFILGRNMIISSDFQTVVVRVSFSLQRCYKIA